MKRFFRKDILTALVALGVCLMAVPGPHPAHADDPPAPAKAVLAQAVRDASDPNDLASYYTLPQVTPEATLNLWVPLACTGADASEITCKADANQFPAQLVLPASLDAVTGAAKDVKLASLAAGAKAYFSFSATVNKAAAAGDYTLPFVVSYLADPADASPTTLSVGVKFQVKAAAPTPVAPAPTDTSSDTGSSDTSSSSSSSSGSGSGFRSKPKVIVDGYSFNAEKLYAGEPVTLTIRLRNTSTREAVKNLQINFSNEAGVIMPQSGGSNSLYIGELKKNADATEVLSLQIAPDAEAKAQMLALEITYEGTRNRQEFTEKTNITVPVLQRTRVRTDQPVFYDEALAGQTTSMSVQMFNMGKATLYNCMVEIEGEGLSLEETYYGGNIASGGTMRADLTVKTEVAGEIDGNVRITYEDVYGDRSEEVLPIKLTVNEEVMPAFDPAAEAMTPDGMPEQQTGPGGLAWYWWALMAAIAVALLLVILLKQKQRRARSLEDGGDPGEL